MASFIRTLALRPSLTRAVHQKRVTRTSLLRWPVLRRAASSRARQGGWSSLPPTKRAAWEQLGWREESWAGKRQAPVSALQSWNELSPAEQAAAQYGLGFDEAEWNAQLDLAHGLVQTSANDAQSAPAPTETGGGGLASKLAGAVWGVARAAAPLVGSALAKSRHPAAMVAGHVLQNVGTIAEEMSGPIVVDGIETTLYLDDSGSMNFPTKTMTFTTALQEGRKVMRSLTPLLDGPTRIVKFGSSATTLLPRAEEPVSSTALVGLNWNGDSGGTYMWHMVEQDVLRKYTPGRGKLRLIILTDGHDTHSPPGYNGIDGMNPMMRTLHDAGYDIEWHIVVLGEVEGKDKYASLAAATGGSFLSCDRFDEDGADAAAFLDAVDESSRGDHEARRRRQQQYELEARAGRAQRFDWFKALPPSK